MTNFNSLLPSDIRRPAGSRNEAQFNELCLAYAKSSFIPARYIAFLGEITENDGRDCIIDMLRMNATDSVVLGICTKCGALHETEPDARDNYCDECNSSQVKSCLILAGLI